MTLSDADQPLTNNYTLEAQLTGVKDSNSQLQLDLFKLNQLVDENNDKNYSSKYYSLEILNERRLDREQIEFVDLEFKLSDIFQVSFIRLRIMLVDVNDQRPQFNKALFKFSVEENQLRFNFAQLTGFDLDVEPNNNKINYRILNTNNKTLIKQHEHLIRREDGDEEDDPNFLFYIESSSGNISLRLIFKNFNEFSCPSDKS